MLKELYDDRTIYPTAMEIAKELKLSEQEIRFLRQEKGSILARVSIDTQREIVCDMCSAPLGNEIWVSAIACPFREKGRFGWYVEGYLCDSCAKERMERGDLAVFHKIRSLEKYVHLYEETISARRG